MMGSKSKASEALRQFVSAVTTDKSGTIKIDAVYDALPLLQGHMNCRGFEKVPVMLDMLNNGEIPPAAFMKFMGGIKLKEKTVTDKSPVNRRQNKINRSLNASNHSDYSNGKMVPHTKCSQSCSSATPKDSKVLTKLEKHEFIPALKTIIKSPYAKSTRICSLDDQTLRPRGLSIKIPKQLNTSNIDREIQSMCGLSLNLPVKRTRKMQSVHKMSQKAPSVHEDRRRTISTSKNIKDSPSNDSRRSNGGSQKDLSSVASSVEIPCSNLTLKSDDESSIMIGTVTDSLHEINENVHTHMSPSDNCNVRKSMEYKYDDNNTQRKYTAMVEQDVGMAEKESKTDIYEPIEGEDSHSVESSSNTSQTSTYATKGEESMEMLTNNPSDNTHAIYETLKSICEMDRQSYTTICKELCEIAADEYCKKSRYYSALRNMLVWCRHYAKWVGHKGTARNFRLCYVTYFPFCGKNIFPHRIPTKKRRHRKRGSSRISVSLSC